MSEKFGTKIFHFCFLACQIYLLLCTMDPTYTSSLVHGRTIGTAVLHLLAAFLNILVLFQVRLLYWSLHLYLCIILCITWLRIYHKVRPYSWIPYAALPLSMRYFSVYEFGLVPHPINFWYSTKHEMYPLNLRLLFNCILNFLICASSFTKQLNLLGASFRWIWLFTFMTVYCAISSCLCWLMISIAT